MIKLMHLSEWRQTVPWIADYQVEQDLIISRALVNLYERPKIKENLGFRGGTALNKLFFKPPLRYSEDIDMVQINAQPIGPLIAEIRNALSWLGQPKGRLTNRSVKLTYQYQSIEGVQRKLKLEINTTEHFNVLDLIESEYALESSWFSGTSKIRTYQFDELIATKLRALYQRNKGRDLFDIHFALKQNLIDCVSTVQIFKNYADHSDLQITRANFEINLLAKRGDLTFQNDILNLIPDSSVWLPHEAFDLVGEKLISLLPGKPLKSKDRKLEDLLI
jgi:predicted nucleotidyltransferase component of viral defense system